MRVKYYGWSGISFQFDDTWLGFDPTKAPSPGAGPERVVVCVSHGHPDHFQGASELSRSSDGQLLARTFVVSTPPVIRRLARGRLRNLHAMRTDEATDIGGIKIEGFWWDHMSLLPPESELRAQYLRQFMAHPLALARIAAGGLGAPLQAPTLGFTVTLPDGTVIVNYGEGLHRLTSPERMADIAQRYRPDVLCAAIEPEDADDFAEWLSIIDAPVVLIHEAHRPWRDAFALPHVNLERFGAELNERLPATQVIPLSQPGVELDLECEARS